MQRLPHLIVLLLILGIGIVGHQLTPAAGRLGTHEQLGLPLCLFHRALGIPCPSCGLTTSLATLLQGDWQNAWAIHPFGPLLALCLATIGCAALFGLCRPFRWSRVLRKPWSLRIVVGGTVCYVGVWMARLLIHGS
ncbi:MAG: DUF2752 domain-containing protein [Deltaproteobacteria bacterium]|nr:DUF2752 domain-containing protein [Deltaproteobacteria bacterium]